MAYLISYDISHNSARSRVLKLLRQYSDHYQKSVLECELSRDEIEGLIKKLEIFIDEGDALLVMLTNTEKNNWQLGTAAKNKKITKNISSLIVI